MNGSESAEAAPRGRGGQECLLIAWVCQERLESPNKDISRTAAFEEAMKSTIGFAQTLWALLHACLPPPHSVTLVLLGFVVGGTGGRSLGHKAVRLLMDLGLKGGLSEERGKGAAQGDCCAGRQRRLGCCQIALGDSWFLSLLPPPKRVALFFFLNPHSPV